MLLALLLSAPPVIPYVAEPPVVDGLRDDSAWAEALVLDDLRVIEPNVGADPTDPIEVRLVKDQEALWVLFRCWDSAPETIRAVQRGRDPDFSGDDCVYIAVDPVGSRREGRVFSVGAGGGMGDSLLSASGRQRSAWDTPWEAAVQIDDEGWTAEIRLPWEGLQIQPGVDVWHFNFARQHRRPRELVRWRVIEQGRSWTAFEDDAGLGGFADVKVPTQWTFRPYGVVRHQDNKGDPKSTTGDAGFDLSFDPRPGLRLTVTANTDFAETEVDDRQVNLGRFPLFFPERRDFFLDDSDLYDFGGINRDPLPFYSRRIGLDASGNRQDVDLGVKATGRLGQYRLGFLNTKMKGSGDVDGENLGVLRLRTDVLRESTAGLIMTWGDPAGGRATTAGVDFNWRRSDLEDGGTATGNAWAQFTDNEDSSGGAFGGKLSYSSDTFSIRGGVARLLEGFDPKLGFVRVPEADEWFYGIYRAWRPENPLIRRVRFGMFGSIYDEIRPNARFDRMTFEPLELQAERGDRINVKVERYQEQLADAFSPIEGVSVDAGEYDYWRGSVSWSTPNQEALSGSINLGGGEYYDGDRLQYSGSLDWRVRTGLAAAVAMEWNKLTYAGESELVRVIRARVDVSPSEDVTFNIRLQYDNASDLLGLSGRLRWVLGPDRDFFVAVDEGLLRDEEDSFRPERRAVAAKLGWSIRF